MRIGGVMNVKGLYDCGFTADALAKALKKYLRRCQFSVPILPRNISACEAYS